MPEMQPLRGKVALVTGAAGGLGRGIALALAREGAAVVLNDVNAAAAEETAARLRAEGGEALAAAGSVAERAAVRQVLATALARYGGLDILVNNAGGGLGTPRRLAELTDAHWDLVLDVNLKGTFICCQEAVPLLRARGGGRIVNIASIGGRTASPVTSVAYAAAKGGVIAFTRRLAYELGADGITVNAVAPGFVFSGPRLEEVWRMQSQEEQAMVTASIPLGRHGTVEEVAAAVAFLAGPGASYITGAVLDVNGGRFMG